MGAKSPREPFRSCSGAASQVLADLDSGRSRRPGAAPRPTPGAFLSAPRPKPSHVFLQAGSPRGARRRPRFLTTHCHLLSGAGNCRAGPGPTPKLRRGGTTPGWAQVPLPGTPIPLCSQYRVALVGEQTTQATRSPGPLAPTHMGVTEPGALPFPGQEYQGKPLAPYPGFDYSSLQSPENPAYGLKGRLWPLKLDRTWLFQRMTAVPVLASEGLALCVSWKSDLILSQTCPQPSPYSLGPLCHPHLGHEF